MDPRLRGDDNKKLTIPQGLTCLTCNCIISPGKQANPPEEFQSALNFITILPELGWIFALDKKFSWALAQSIYPFCAL